MKPLNLFDDPKQGDFIEKVAFNSIQTFNDICQKYIPKSISQTRKLAKYLDYPKQEDLTILRIVSLDDFCRTQFKYKEDKFGYEQIRLPRRSWLDRKKGIDCEDFTILCSAVLCNWKIKHKIRMVDYGKGWQHIYVVAFTEYETVIVDPTTSFNTEQKPKKIKDYSIKL